MSHVTRTEFGVQDLDCTDEACVELGAELVRGKRTYKWFGRFLGDTAEIRDIGAENYGKSAHVIRVKNAPEGMYEVGLVRNKADTGWDLVYDAWCGGCGLEARLGKNLSKLRIAYNMAVAAKQLRRQGYKMSRKINEAGKPQLVAWR